MFSGCSNITSINLEGISAKNISCMDFMFSGCKNLIYLNIYNLNTKNDPNCYQIFEGVPKKINIIFDILSTGVRIKKEIDGLSLE